jgi:hypothetical protein
MKRLAPVLAAIDPVDVLGLVGLVILTAGIASRFGPDSAAIAFGALVLLYAVLASRPVPTP